MEFRKKQELVIISKRFLLFFIDDLYLKVCSLMKRKKKEKLINWNLHLLKTKLIDGETIFFVTIECPNNHSYLGTNLERSLFILTTWERYSQTLRENIIIDEISI